MESDELLKLKRKTFSDETMKKVRWVIKMYCEWRAYCNSQETLEDIYCDLDDISMITKESLVFGVCRFLTEVKKLDGGEFPG